MLTVARLLVLLLFVAPAIFAQGKIVFVRQPTGSSQGNELWVHDLANSTSGRIVTMPSYIVTPRWSPDGGSIAFQSGTILWTVNPDGSGLSAVPGASVADSGLTWDAVGTGFVYATVSVCSETLRAVDRDGTNNRPFASFSVASYPDARPADVDTYVAFSRNQCGWEFRADPVGGIELTRDNDRDHIVVPVPPDANRQDRPRWSPAGNELLTAVRLGFTAPVADPNQVYALEIFNPFDLNQPRERPFAERPGFGEFDFGCTAGSIFFSRASEGHRNIWRINRDGTGLTPVTNFDAGSIHALDFRCEPIVVAIDIKPGSFPNSVNLGSGGTVPVAIFSSTTFDAKRVDPLTVTLAGAGVNLRGRGTPLASLEDVNGDGLAESVVHIRTEALQISEGDTHAVLEGRTFDGDPFRGMDTVRVVR